MLTTLGTFKVRVSKEGVAAFNARWPGSTLRPSRAYWFEFDRDGDLVDTDCPEHDDGPAVLAMVADCKTYLFDGEVPEWT
jgi:hypothetical protein